MEGKEAIDTVEDWIYDFMSDDEDNEFIIIDNGDSITVVLK